MVEAFAEAMPFAARQFDVVTCIYLFHELPPAVRRVVAGEIRRVLKPGGTLVFVDSLGPATNPTTTRCSTISLLLFMSHITRVTWPKISTSCSR